GRARGGRGVARCAGPGSRGGEGRPPLDATARWGCRRRRAGRHRLRRGRPGASAGRCTVGGVRVFRHCTRAACANPAVATLTYVYADSTAVLGPLATHPEPHSYDLCEEHAHRLTAPRGWEVVRLATEFVPAPPSPDDIEALAEAAREASKARPGPSLPADRPSKARAPGTRRLPEPAAGRRAHHQKFGPGTVTEVDGNKLTIEFDHAGKKRVVDSFVARI